MTSTFYSAVSAIRPVRFGESASGGFKITNFQQTLEQLKQRIKEIAEANPLTGWSLGKQIPVPCHATALDLYINRIESRESALTPEEANALKLARLLKENLRAVTYDRIRGGGVHINWARLNQILFDKVPDVGQKLKQTGELDESMIRRINRAHQEKWAAAGFPGDGDLIKLPE